MILYIVFIAPVTKYSKAVIPAKAGIHEDTGCPRIAVRDRLLKSGMTKLAYSIAELIKSSSNEITEAFKNDCGIETL
jgi:hypothetical protein